MKFFIVLSLLTLNVLASDYVLNDDYTYTYVGSCSLHEDYEHAMFRTIKVLVPTEYYPGVDFYKSLDPVSKDLFARTYELAMYEGFDLKNLENWRSLDDIEITQIVHYSTGEELYRVNYGVGGGNGGFLTFSVTPNSPEVYTVVAHTFDQDIYDCNENYNISRLSLDCRAVSDEEFRRENFEAQYGITLDKIFVKADGISSFVEINATNGFKRTISEPDTKWMHYNVSESGVNLGFDGGEHWIDLKRSIDGSFYGIVAIDQDFSFYVRCTAR